MKVIKIGASWCSGCMVMKPRWAKIEKDNPWLATQYFDYDEDKDKLQTYKLDTGKLPTFIFLNKDGEEIERLSGEVEKSKLLELINKYKDK